MNIRVLIFIAIVLCVTPFTGSAKNTDAAEPFVLAIDAGHGGHDKGTPGRRISEKFVTLDVARRLRTLVSEAFGDSVKIVMTRDADVFVPLDQRARIANDAEADLFISIHINSVARRSKGRERLEGASVYTLGLHKTEANLEVAMAENSVIELESDFSEKYQGFDPNQSESYIIFELTQNNNVIQSVEMASLVQQYLTTHASRKDRGVLQAGFLVLWATKMPAILAELDFMCNPRVENFLDTPSGRQKLAEALFMGFRDYRALHPAHRTHNAEK